MKKAHFMLTLTRGELDLVSEALTQNAKQKRLELEKIDHLRREIDDLKRIDDTRKANIPH